MDPKGVQELAETYRSLDKEDRERFRLNEGLLTMTEAARASENSVTKVTDEQLKAECARRKMEMDPWLEAATTGELLAECERRGLGLAEMSTETLAKALKIRGLNGFLVEGLTDPALRAVGHFVEHMRTSREPMKLVAADAETVPTGFTLEAARMMPTGAFTVEAFKARVDELLALEAMAKNPVMIVECDKIGPKNLEFLTTVDAFAFKRATMTARNVKYRPDESGPGIAAMPQRLTEPHAHLDVDLLCDDAD